MEMSAPVKGVSVRSGAKIGLAKKKNA